MLKENRDSSAREDFGRWILETQPARRGQPSIHVIKPCAKSDRFEGMQSQMYPPPCILFIRRVVLHTLEEGKETGS